MTPLHEPSPARSITPRTERLWMGDDGILRILPPSGSAQTRADAVENVAAIEALIGARRPPALADVRRAQSVDRDARAYYADRLTLFSALAIVTGSPLSRMIGTFFIGFNKLAAPVRLFTSESDAIAWLRGFVG